MNSPIYIRIVDKTSKGYIIEDIERNTMLVTAKQIAVVLKSNQVYSDNIALCNDTNRVQRIINTDDDMVGTTYGNWKVLAITETNNVYCECLSCKKTHIISRDRLLNNIIPKCKCESSMPKMNLVGQHFGEWEVLSYAGNGKWECRCSCEQHTIQYIKTNYLIHNKTKSCGCITNKLKDLTDKYINSWHVLEYVGDRKWKCQCSCGTIKNVHSYTLTHNMSKNCGAGVHMVDKFGETTPQKFNNPREKWQIDTLEDVNKLKNFLISSTNKCSEYIADKLGVTKSTLLIKIHKYGLEDYIILNPKQSFMETQIADYISSIYTGVIVQNTRKILPSKKELDIYIPEFKLAIEINGNYFHSSKYKDRYYHYNKFMECSELGIRLIQIYEYEYNDNLHIDIIHDIIKRALRKTRNIVYARNTIVKTIGTEDERDFLNKNHLQGYNPSRKAYGIYLGDKLLQVVSIGKPRFNSNHDIEIVRECTLLDTIVLGGLEKIYSTINKDYPNNNVISYCNNDKFDGKHYLKHGFTLYNITKPGYIWLDVNKNSVIQRYKTMKHKLIDKGLGIEEQTEEDIMNSLGCYKIYNSGNKVFVRRFHND